MNFEQLIEKLKAQENNSCEHIILKSSIEDIENLEDRKKAENSYYLTIGFLWGLNSQKFINTSELLELMSLATELLYTS